jgi:hypothetical protein
MLNLPLVVTPFLLALVLIAALVGERWLRMHGARGTRAAVLAITGLLCAWGLVVIAGGAHAAYMAMPPDLPAGSAR